MFDLRSLARFVKEHSCINILYPHLLIMYYWDIIAGVIPG